MLHLMGARGADGAAAPVVAASMAFYARALTMAGRSAAARCCTRGEGLSPFCEPHRDPRGIPSPLRHPDPPGALSGNSAGAFFRNDGGCRRASVRKAQNLLRTGNIEAFHLYKSVEIEARGSFVRAATATPRHQGFYPPAPIKKLDSTHVGSLRKHGGISAQCHGVALGHPRGHPPPPYSQLTPWA